MNFQMAGEEGMGSCAITTGTSQDSFHVISMSFAQTKHTKKMLSKWPTHVRCCVQVSCYYDGKLQVQQLKIRLNYWNTNVV